PCCRKMRCLPFRALQSICLFHQTIGEIMRHFQSFVFLQAMLSDQLCEECTIYASSHIVPSRNGEESPRVIVEADRIVKSRRFSRKFAETHHPLRTVVKPPRRTNVKARIVSCQRCKFSAVGRLIQCENNDR